MVDPFAEVDLCCVVVVAVAGHPPLVVVDLVAEGEPVGVGHRQVGLTGRSRHGRVTARQNSFGPDAWPEICGSCPSIQFSALAREKTPPGWV